MAAVGTNWPVRLRRLPVLFARDPVVPMRWLICALDKDLSTSASCGNPAEAGTISPPENPNQPIRRLLINK